MYVRTPRSFRNTICVLAIALFWGGFAFAHDDLQISQVQLPGVFSRDLRREQAQPSPVIKFVTPRIGEGTNPNKPISIDRTAAPPLPLNNLSRQDVLPLPLPEQAASPPTYPINEPSEEVLRVLREGREFEKNLRWADALGVYETAIRAQQTHPLLQSRYRMARYHVDIARRARDNSYEKMLANTTLADTLAIYEQIVFWTQKKHVEIASYDDLFRYGIDDFAIALLDPGFLKNNGLTQDKDTIAGFIIKVQRTAGGWMIRNNTDLKNGTLKIAEMAQLELGLRPTAVVMEFACGAANSLDTVSAYLTLNQLNDTNGSINGNFVGIGVELDSDPESLIILKVFEGSPAASAGLKAGDRIISVDGKATKGLSTDVSADFLQGDAGISVKLLAQSKNEPPRSLEITRQIVHYSSVEDVHMLNDTVGYAKLSSFQTQTREELEAALWKLHGQGMQCFVLDLRRNPGGLLRVSVDVANMFIEDGLILRTRSRGGRLETPYSATREGTWKVPLVVLIDEESASAAEIFAGAMKDHRRAVIVGEKSYGKGTVQAIYELKGLKDNNPVAGFRLTVEKFYSPKGLPFNGIGIEPDVRAIEDEIYTVARPIDGQLPPKAIASRRPVAIGSSPNDPCIRKAIETAERIMTANRPEPTLGSL